MRLTKQTRVTASEYMDLVIQMIYEDLNIVVRRKALAKLRQTLEAEFHRREKAEKILEMEKLAKQLGFTCTEQVKDTKR